MRVPSRRHLAARRRTLKRFDTLPPGYRAVQPRRQDVALRCPTRHRHIGPIVWHGDRQYSPHGHDVQRWSYLSISPHGDALSSPSRQSYNATHGQECKVDHTTKVAVEPRLAATVVVTSIGYTCILYAHGVERSNAVATRSLRTALEFHDSSRLGCLREDKGEENRTYLRSYHHWVAPGCSSVRKVPCVPARRIQCQCGAHISLYPCVTYSS